MFRVIRQECGNSFTATTQTPYTCTYSQPIHNYLIAKLYHRWESLTWRCYRKIEKPLMRRYYRKHPDDLFYIPLTNRQDERCFHLKEKNRKVLHMTYGVSEEWNTDGRREAPSHDPSPGSGSA